ncbi:MAG: secretin N-terminal domain-containing protein, partial [Planctomycetota bacterium]|nr:secretin N-terminal domain-containing protein [Planctomycetota bacterium]
PQPAAAKVESVLVELGSLDAITVQSILKKQSSGMGDIAIEGKALRISGDANSIRTMQEAIAVYQLGHQDPANFLPVPGKPIALLNGQGARSLGAVFEEYCQQVGVKCLMNDNAQRSFYSVKPNILGLSELQPEAAVSFLQLSLQQNGFLLDLVPSKKGVILRLLAHNDLGTPILLDPSRLAAYASQHALMVQTVISLPNTDMRSMSNVLRQLIRNPGKQTILPLGSANGMLIQGSGPWVYQLSQVLMLADQVSKEQGDRIRKARTLATEVIRLDYADPKDVLFHLEKFYPTPGKGKPRITTSIDPRLNALILRCSQADRDGILDLIARLDVK